VATYNGSHVVPNSQLGYTDTMKFLLTSNGLSNQSIADALFDLVGKPAEEVSIAFIPTAMNVGRGDKSWFINDLDNIRKQKPKLIDIVDISALPKDNWLPRLESMDVLFFSGGNTNHLMRWLKESGLADALPNLLQTRVYAGISAGSMVTNPSLALSSNDKKIYYEEKFGYRNEEALNLVEVYVRPHYNSEYFPDAKKAVIEEFAKNTAVPIYGLDDDSALKIVDGIIEVVSEGNYEKFN
jgi:dipeptidase E